MAFHRWRHSLRGFALPAGIAAIILFSAQAPQNHIAGAQTGVPAKHAGRRPCMPVEEASRQPNLNKDICVSAHVFDVVELTDGTRFLDVCAADVPDNECRFTLMSLHADSSDVGDLRKYRNQDVTVRGVVRATHGRMGIVISHVRQFSGGPEKFRPNPKLLHDFNGQSDRLPVRDPNLASSGRHRSFMNTSDKENLPVEQKH